MLSNQILIENTLKGKNIVILTEVFYGSGDFSAAKKLIEYLDSLYGGDIKIQWLIFTRQGRKDVPDKANSIRKQFGSNIQVNVFIDNLNSLKTNELGKVDLILFYVTIHHLPTHSFHLLQSLGAPIIQAYEYDANSKKHLAPFKYSLIRVKTGFAYLGLFFDNLEKIAVPDVINDPLFKILRIDDKQTEMFFSYEALDERYVSNEANFKNYYQLALKLAEETKSVDIVTNYDVTSCYSIDYTKLAWEQGFSSIVYIGKDKNGDLVELKKIEGPEKKAPEKELRIINPFPLTYPQMIFSMKHAHPFMRLTGDQSLSEVYSLVLSGKLIFPIYQCMIWKTQLYEHWLEFAAATVGKSSGYFKLLNLFKPNTPFNLDEFVKIWQTNKDEILKDSERLATALEKDRNLSKNFSNFLNLFLAGYQEVKAALHNEFANLLVQLVAKLHLPLNELDQLAKDIIAREATDLANQKTILVALTEFLKLNSVEISKDDLLQIEAQLRSANPENRVFIAIAARNFLNYLPENLKTRYLTMIIPEINKLNEVQREALIESISNYTTSNFAIEDWFQSLLNKINKETGKTRTTNPNYPILLAVKVFADGSGDLAKFNSVYKTLAAKYSQSKIRPLVLYREENKHAVLKMLRNDHIPINLCEFGFSNIYQENYSLIISVATPIPDLHKLREAKTSRVDFLEIAEPDFASFGKERELLAPKDEKHHLVSMGLDQNSIGVEIHQPANIPAEDVFSYLSATLAEKILGIPASSMTRDQLTTFLKTSFIFPAYFKNENGGLRIDLPLLLMQYQDPSIKNFILWMPTLPADKINDAFNQKLIQAGFTTLIIFSGQDKLEYDLSKTNKPGKTLRIITGVLKTNDFNLLHQLAIYAGGMAGSVGQNSFELDTSYGLLPIFFARERFLQPILFQVQAILSEVFDYHSLEHHQLDSYFRLLLKMSEFYQILDRLFETSEIQPYVKELSAATPEEFTNILIHLAETKIPELKDFPILLEKHPLLQFQEFLNQYPLSSLIDAWQKVAIHIQKNYDMNKWVLKQVEKYALTPEKETLPSDENYIRYNDISLKEQESYVLLTSSNYPAIHKYVFHGNADIEQLLQENNIQVAISNAQDYFITTYAQMDKPTITISALALTTLSPDELYFGLKLVMLMFAAFPIEKTPMFIGELNTLDIEKLGMSLKYGKTYSRALIKVLTEKLSALPEDAPFDFRWLYRTTIETYQTLIIKIKTLLATQGKYTLSKDQSLSEAPTIKPRAVVEECKHLVFAEVQLSEEKKPIEFEDLIAQLKSLSVKFKQEYYKDTYKSEKFLQLLSHSNFDKNQYREIIDVAYEYKVAAFDKIYLLALQKMKFKSVVTLGVFEQLEELINKFIASSPDDLNNNVVELYSFLTDPKINSLFIRKDSLRGKAEAIEKITPLTPLLSTIGSQIAWDIYIERNKLDNKVDSFINIAIQQNNQELAYILFRLGYINKRSLWPILPLSLITKFYFNPLFIGGVNSGVDINHSQSAQVFERINEPLFIEFIPFKYGHFEKIENFSGNILEIENFIKNNLNTLAFADFIPECENELIHYFHIALKTFPEEAKSFLKKFFVDPNYPYGLHEILQKRHELIDDSRLYYSFMTVSQGRTSSYGQGTDYEKIPYTRFLLATSATPILSLPEQLEILIKMIDNIIYVPLAFILSSLKLSIANVADVMTAFEKINDLGQYYVDPEISHLYKASILFIKNSLSSESVDAIKDFDLFSKNTFQYIELIATQFTNQREIYLKIWANSPNFKDQLRNYPYGKIELSILELSQLYKTFDSRVSFPDVDTRNRLSEILLIELSRQSDVDSLKALESLLFTAPIQLSDTLLTDKLIKMWVEIQAKQLSLDNGSKEYYQNIVPLLIKVIDSVPTNNAIKMLNGLLTEINAQGEICEFVNDQLNKNNFSIKNSNLHNKLISVTEEAAEYGITQDFVEFLMYELTPSTLDKMLDVLANTQQKTLPSLAKLYNFDPDKIDPTSLRSLNAFLLTSFYHQFWALPIELRSLLLEHLFITKKNVKSEQDEFLAYSQAFAFICDQLFPDKTSENKMLEALLESYLSAAEANFRSFLLTAVITASKAQANSKNKSYVSFLPKLAEALGPAGIKIGQAAHSYPYTPPDLVEALSSLKSQAKLPYRWELHQLIKQRLAPEHFNQIEEIGRLLGGASFYIAVEVKLKDGSTAVLRLLRENAQKESAHGFAHIEETIRQCENDDINDVKPNLEQILQDAQGSAKIETDDKVIKQQYQIAHQLYNDKPENIRHANQKFSIHIKPVQLFIAGNGYQIISKADGIEFNKFKKDPKNKEISQAIAFAICKKELTNMLSGTFFDADRHGGQAHVVITKNKDKVDVNVTYFDFGEISPYSTKDDDLANCREFLRQLLVDLAWRSITYVPEEFEMSFVDIAINKMLAYINKELEQSHQDINKQLRLRGIFKGVLALQDYFAILQTDKELMNQLKKEIGTQIMKQLPAMGKDYAAQVVTRFLPKNQR